MAQRTRIRRSSSELPARDAPGAPRDGVAETVRLAPVDPLGGTLTTILKEVNDWLKFAEGKNAGVVGLASAGTLALASAIPNRVDDAWGIRLGYAVAVLLVTAGLFAGLASFMPRTNLAGMLGRRAETPGEDDNLLFYGHLARYDPRGLAETVARRYCGDAQERVTGYHVDVAAQIVTNARITIAKLRLFSYALLLFGSAAAVLVVTVVVSVLA